MNWINNTLGIERTANILWDGADGFDFQILESPAALDRAIRGGKAEEGFSARLAAGFCWPWSRKPNKDGTLVEKEVVVWRIPPALERKVGGRREAWLLVFQSPRSGPRTQMASSRSGAFIRSRGSSSTMWELFGDPTSDTTLRAQSWVGDKKASADTVVKRSKEPFSGSRQEHLSSFAEPRPQGLLHPLHGQRHRALCSAVGWRLIEFVYQGVGNGIAK